MEAPRIVAPAQAWLACLLRQQECCRLPQGTPERRGDSGCHLTIRLCKCSLACVSTPLLLTGGACPAAQLFPYHLADYVCRVLRVTPFRYYCDLLFTVMRDEKSYDQIPNFTVWFPLLAHLPRLCTAHARTTYNCPRWDE